MTTQAIGHAAPRTTSLSIPASRLWTGRVLTAIPILFLTFDGASKVANIAPVREAMVQLGYAADAGVGIGIILLACVALYTIPRTAVLGAILLTGYLGGAIATHVRVGNPLFSHTLFPIYIAAMVWGGLYLRDARLRALVPLRAAE
ncbi:MAG TPA: DoxX family protein [Longimicrobium sp.]|jgi:hypothetical protein